MSPARSQEPPANLPKPYRIQIADDHALIRRGVRTLLEMEPGVVISSESTNGLDTIEDVKKNHPDLLLLDLTMPEKNGLEVAAIVHQESPDTDIIILTIHFSEEVAREALRCGALGYMLKSDADTDLINAVRHVRHKRSFFTGCLAHKMIEAFVEDARAALAPDEGIIPGVPLTAREIEILRLLATGESNKHVANVIGLSMRTVESHRTHIMRKMKFENFSDLVRFAVRNNLIDP